MLLPRTAALALLGLAAWGCAREPAPDGNGPKPRASTRTDPVGPGRTARVSPVEALRLSHATVRAALGPHRLELRSHLKLVPVEAGTPNPALDSPVAPRQVIASELRLTWGEPDAAGPRFSLRQSNDAGLGRSVVVTGGHAYTQLDPRPWTRHLLETDVYELWLDDAQFAARDVVDFLAPGASLAEAVLPGAGVDGGDAVQLTLTPTPGARTPAATDGWRAGVAFDALEAVVRLDAATGAWLQIDASARYTVLGGAGGPLEGNLEVHGTVTALSATEAQVDAPGEVVPLQERHRYEAERKRLLDGLAAP